MTVNFKINARFYLYTYTVDSPFPSYPYWPIKPQNRDNRQYIHIDSTYNSYRLLEFRTMKWRINSVYKKIHVYIVHIYMYSSSYQVR